MIQDIKPAILRNEYSSKEPGRSSVVFFFDGNHMLVQEDEPLTFYSYAEFDSLLNQTLQGAIREQVSYAYLFCIQRPDREEQDFFLALLPETQESLAAKEDVELDPEKRVAFENTYGSLWKMRPIHMFRGAAPQEYAFAAITAFQLYNWYRDHRYCGRCARPLHPDAKERMLRCDCCGNMEFPKIAPAVIVAVQDGNRLLMTKYAGRSYQKYALIAGFNEIGESIEDTVRREVMEEAGLRVKDITFYKSQPWALTSTLLMGFAATLDGSDEIHMDAEELAAAEWVKREDIVLEDDHVSLTWEMIERFKNLGRI